MDREFVSAWVPPGAHIIDVLCEARDRANFCQMPVKFYFNEIEVTVNPGVKVSKMYLIYLDKLGGDVRGAVNQ